MWVMTKRIKGRQYLYLYKSVWANGKPRSVFVRYLGPKDGMDEARLAQVIEHAAEEEAARTPP